MSDPTVLLTIATLAGAAFALLPALWKDHEATFPVCPKCHKNPAVVEMDDGYSMCVDCYKKHLKIS